jgi:hypothetical protein
MEKSFTVGQTRKAKGDSKMLRFTTLFTRANGSPIWGLLGATVGMNFRDEKEAVNWTTNTSSNVGFIGLKQGDIARVADAPSREHRMQSGYFQVTLFDALGNPIQVKRVSDGELFNAPTVQAADVIPTAQKGKDGITVIKGSK